ncbi:hypothetical protein TNCV_2131201 [Trichonephila clavipes]|nr:hypothetical protein TNCV_2131201 [Trichonephila clavipes]
MALKNTLSTCYGNGLKLVISSSSSATPAVKSGALKLSWLKVPPVGVMWKLMPARPRHCTMVQNDEVQQNSCCFTALS